MAVENLKSTFVTNLDSVPPLTNTAGEGGPNYLRSIEGSAVPSAAASVTSTYRLCRIPTTACVKELDYESAAQGAGTFDFGLYYSTGAQDGTPPSLQGLVVDQDFFSSAISFATAIAKTDGTNEGGFYPIDARTKPIWQAAGLAADPGGFFDVVATVVSVAVTTGTGRLGVTVKYTD